MSFSKPMSSGPAGRIELPARRKLDWTGPSRAERSRQSLFSRLAILPGLRSRSRSFSGTPWNLAAAFCATTALAVAAIGLNPASHAGPSPLSSPPAAPVAPSPLLALIQKAALPAGMVGRPAERTPKRAASPESKSAGQATPQASKIRQIIAAADIDPMETASTDRDPAADWLRRDGKTAAVSEDNPFSAELPETAAALVPVSERMMQPAPETGGPIIGLQTASLLQPAVESTDQAVPRPGNRPTEPSAASPVRGAASWIKSGVKLRAGPTNSAKVIGVLTKGTKVAVVKCDYWCEVKADGKQGWVYKSYVARPRH